jgi:hypothetical protein
VLLFANSSSELVVMGGSQISNGRLKGKILLSITTSEVSFTVKVSKSLTFEHEKIAKKTIGTMIIRIILIFITEFILVALNKYNTFSY